jgi:antitoxin ParD1/3/4
MQAVYHCNMDELSNEFIAGLKKQFAHAKVDIVVHEMDETEYLNSHPVNRAQLHKAIEQVRLSNVIQKTPSELGL